MAKQKTSPSSPLVLTSEEIAAVLTARDMEIEGPIRSTSTSTQELANALTLALKAAQPPSKKTVATRTKLTPWTPTDGSPKITKFKRPMYHHGIEIIAKRTSNENCLLLDKLKPGTYCDGFVKVIKRRDGGLDIDYLVRTNAQRLRLLNQLRINTFGELIQRLLDERANPAKYYPADDDD